MRHLDGKLIIDGLPLMSLYGLSEGAHTTEDRNSIYLNSGEPL